MVKTVRFLRVALPIVFVLFVATIILNYRSTNRKPAAPGEPVKSDLRSGDKPRSVSHAFEDTQTLGGRVVSRLRAAKMIAFESGWYTLEDIELTLFRKDGGSYTINAKQAQVHKDTRHAEATGGVQVASSDGISLRTNALRYDGNRMHNDGGLDFTFDHWRGHAGAFELNVEGQTLQVKQLTVSGDPPTAAEPPMSISADSAQFRRTAGEAEFKQNVRLTRGSDRVSADQMLARLDVTKKILTGLEGSGNVRMAIARTSPLLNDVRVNDVGRTNVQSKRFFTEFAGNGEVSSFLLAGEEGIATATMQGPPERYIQAHNLRFLLSGGVITEFRGETEFLLREGARTVSSVNARGYFDPMTGDARSLVAEIDVIFREGAREGRADRATYEFLTRKVTLNSGAGGAVRLTTESESLRAQAVEILGNDETLKAMGTVVAQMKPKQSTSASDTALFPDKGPVFINSDTAFFMKKDESALFSGNVRAWQGQNAVLSKELQIRNGGESLLATGGVRASLVNTKAATRSTILSRSDTLTAKRSERRVDLDGNVRVEDAGRTLQSSKATFFMDAKQKIDRMEATGSVTMDEPAARRKVTGDRAVYRIEKREVIVEGSPASITDPQGTIKGNQIIADLEKNKVQVVSGTTPAQATYNPQQ
jgi:LPS export ABC transporter protein LptC/lipopolysaccharide transport protein LptA